MSAKGQLVVPQDMRETAGYKEGDRFVAISTPEGIAFKRLNFDELAADYERITKELRKHMKEKKITQKDIDKAIRWAREQS